MDILEVVLEFFCEVYIDLIDNMLPNKEVGKKTRMFLRVLCALISVGAILCAVIGVTILCESNIGKEDLTDGIILVAVAAVVFIINIILAIFNAKKKKDKKSVSDYLEEKKQEEENK